jgi:hypothetical protein
MVLPGQHRFQAGTHSTSEDAIQARHPWRFAGNIDSKLGIHGTSLGNIQVGTHALPDNMIPSRHHGTSLGTSIPSSAYMAPLGNIDSKLGTHRGLWEHDSKLGIHGTSLGNTIPAWRGASSATSIQAQLYMALPRTSFKLGDQATAMAGLASQTTVPSTSTPMVTMSGGAAEA